MDKMYALNNGVTDVLTSVVVSYLLDDTSSLCFCLVNRHFSSILKSGMMSSLFWVKRLEHKLCVDVDVNKYTSIDWKEVYLSTKEYGGDRNLLLHDDPYVVKLGLLTGIDPSVETPWMSDPLYDSCESGNTEVCKLLLECGKYDLSSDGRERFNLLFVSIDKGYTEIVKLLLEDGKIDPCQRRGTLLSLSMKRGNRGVCELLSSDKRVQNSRYIRMFK